MRIVLVFITLLAFLAPGSAVASTNGGELTNAPEAGIDLPGDAPSDSSWIMPKKMRRMQRRASEGPAVAVPEPSAALVFGAGALIAAARLRRRRYSA